MTIKKNSLFALGIMNGTSIDGVDYALIKVAKKDLSCQFVEHFHRSLPKTLKARLLSAAKDAMSVHELSLLHADLGRLYKKHIQTLKLSKTPDVIGLHGQTVHHKGKTATLQIGNPSFIKAAQPKALVVYDFRSMDIALGGQGAPFAPFFQKYILPKSKNTIAFQNLGGIANLTHFAPKTSVAFDSGPANILLDAWIQQATKGRKSFDKNGQTAAKGLFEEKCLQKFLLHPYFKKRAPKSCGREEFNLKFIESRGGTLWKKLSLEDQMATLTELTAVSLTGAYKKWLPQLPQTIYTYGGGLQNSQLMKRIRYHLPECEWVSTDQIGWPGQAFEASLIAFLAAARVWNKKVHIPKITGAKSAGLLGSLL